MLKCVYVRVVKVLECGDGEGGLRMYSILRFFIECEFQMNDQKETIANE